MNSQIRHRRIAKRIVDRLFTNGAKEQAERLVLELHDKRDGGGWCRTAAADQIIAILNRYLP
jgi:hypothetical protein